MLNIVVPRVTTGLYRVNTSLLLLFTRNAIRNFLKILFSWDLKQPADKSPPYNCCTPDSYPLRLDWTDKTVKEVPFSVSANGKSKQRSVCISRNACECCILISFCLRLSLCWLCDFILTPAMKMVKTGGAGLGRVSSPSCTVNSAAGLEWHRTCDVIQVRRAT